MKKILFVWLSIWSLAMVWSSLQDPGSETPNTSIKDISGEQHVYRDFSVNTDNWCIIHKKYELVERRIPPKKLKKRTLPRKNQKNTKLI